jgi:ADP-ribose pyrophosphatase
MASSNGQIILGRHWPYRGRLLNLRVDKIRLPNGHTVTREIVEARNSVCVAPLDGFGNVILVKQYRQAVGEFLLEVPAGGIEPNEKPLDAAHRELEEETGFVAKHIMFEFFFWATPGISTEGMYAYSAEGLELHRQLTQDDENIEVVHVSLDNVKNLISTGKIRDGKTIALLNLILIKKI